VLPPFDGLVLTGRDYDQLLSEADARPELGLEGSAEAQLIAEPLAPPAPGTPPGEALPIKAVDPMPRTSSDPSGADPSGADLPALFIVDPMDPGEEGGSAGPSTGLDPAVLPVFVVDPVPGDGWSGPAVPDAPPKPDAPPGALLESELPLEDGAAAGEPVALPTIVPGPLPWLLPGKTVQRGAAGGAPASPAPQGGCWKPQQPKLVRLQCYAVVAGASRCTQSSERALNGLLTCCC
jgi:hypothetical protein